MSRRAAIRIMRESRQDETRRDETRDEHKLGEFRNCAVCAQGGIVAA